MAENRHPATRDGPLGTWDGPQNDEGVRPSRQPSSGDSVEKTIVVRDRRKPNQYTTDNVIAREWLPILRVGDAFFFYSVYLSMANRETESSWGSLRTQAEYLQCGVDLIIRGNKLLEICELIYIETGDQRTTNEYYILDPPPLTPELKARICQRLDAIAAEESSKNWQSWVKQVRRALDRHRSLPSIWAERRNKRGGRPVKTVRAQKGVREPQPGLGADEPRAGKGACEPQPGYLWDTTRVLVGHNQGACEPQAEQEQLTRESEQEWEEEEETLSLVRTQCHQLGVAPAVVAILLENHPPERILQQLEWLPYRGPRDPAAMLVSAVQGDWERPAQYPVEGVGDVRPTRPREARAVWPGEGTPGCDSDGVRGRGRGSTEHMLAADGELGGNGFTLPGTDVDAREVWAHVLGELRMQMTRAAFDTWLGGAQVVGVREEAIAVQVRDAYAAEWLASRWSTPIERTLSGIVGRPMAVYFTGQDPQGSQGSWS